MDRPQTNSDEETVAIRELPSFVGIAESGDGELSIKVDEILYGEQADIDTAA